LSDEEARFFSDHDPLGFILFKRNCESPAQVRALIADLRASIGRDDAPVLIDEEGGRVQRLGPPAWPDFPAAQKYREHAETDEDEAIDLARRAAMAQASQLSGMGFTVNAAPVLDLWVSGASAVVGERSYASKGDMAARFGAAVIEGLMAGGVMPIIKHFPGHGRATVDSHVGLPHIDVRIEHLRGTDFAPFVALKDCPWGMVGHLLLTKVDDRHPASCSPVVIDEIIRAELGFEGLLLSDDLSMGALDGGLGDRAAAAIAAGCDIAVHCNSVMDEMEQVADRVGPMTAEAVQRLADGWSVFAEREGGHGRIDDVAGEVAMIVQTLANA
ncbi:MAG: beta-N-acetylhexosaminidase, partial [Pseudomonadota bacterium]